MNPSITKNRPDDPEIASSIHNIFQREVLFAVPLLVVIILGILVVYAWKSYEKFDLTARRDLQLQELGAIITNLDEVLTMSARMAAATGDLKWEKRYRQHEPTLDSAIRAAMESAPEAFLSEAARQTNNANIKLVAMENQAFDLVRHTKRGVAAELLSSGEYENQKQSYAGGIKQIISTMHERSFMAAQLQRRNALVAVMTIVTVLLVLLIAWLVMRRILGRHDSERKRADEALQHEHNVLRTLIDSLPDLIYFKDAEGRYILNNRPHLRSLGMERQEEVLGKSTFDFNPRELSEQYHADEMRIVQTGTALLDREERALHKDTGEHRWHLTSKIPLIDSQGKVSGIVGISRDITERKRAEETLQHERTLLRTVIDNLPDAIYAKDTACRKTLANLFDLHNMGRQSEAEVLGKDDFDLFAKDVAEKFFADDQSVLQTGKPVVNREEYLIDAEGQKRWLLTSKYPLEDAEGRVVGLVGIGRDITKRRIAEEALRESAEKFRFVFENAYDGMSIFEETPDRQQRRLVECNARYAEMSGRSREELLQIGITSNLARTLSLDDRQSVEHGAVFSGSFSWNRPDGKDNIIEYTAVPIKMEGKMFAIGIDRDVTERRRTEAEREKLIAELQSALSDVSTLSGLVPICANCKKIRDDKGYWTQLERYIQERSAARFSHGICPDCMKKLYPDFTAKNESRRF
jgi:PAS domain S-box-containing protein